MHVLRHECIGMQLSTCLRQRLSEPMQIRKTVLIAKETRFAVMATLYDVQRDIVQVNALSARHEPILSQNNRAWPL
jgi:hypothetical protein